MFPNFWKTGHYFVISCGKSRRLALSSFI